MAMRKQAAQLPLLEAKAPSKAKSGTVQPPLSKGKTSAQAPSPKRIVATETPPRAKKAAGKSRPVARSLEKPLIEARKKQASPPPAEPVGPPSGPAPAKKGRKAAAAAPVKASPPQAALPANTPEKPRRRASAADPGTPAPARKKSTPPSVTVAEPKQRTQKAKAASPEAVPTPEAPAKNKRVKASSTPKPASVEKPRPAAAEPTPKIRHPFRGYRVTWEDGCEAEVRASIGSFYPFDGDTVAFYCQDLNIARQIRRKWASEVEIFAQGDEETTLHLPAKLYPQVASLIGVARRAA
jgi:hypothetical protein